MNYSGRDRDGLHRHCSYSHLSHVTSGEEDAFQTAAPQTCNQWELHGGLCLHVQRHSAAHCDICPGTCAVLQAGGVFLFFIPETYGDEECSCWVFTVRPSGGRCDPDKSGRLPVTYLTFPEVKLRLIHHSLHLCASLSLLYIFALLLTAAVPRRLRKLLRK